jgi:imidazolonepropionase
MGRLRVLDDACVRCEGGLVRSIDDSAPACASGDVLDAQGRVLLPAFVDCHTHALWAGSRHDEWEQRLRGASYLEMLRRGGGIISTVRAVRNTSDNDLHTSLKARLDAFARHGTLTVEVKSGYGLTTHDELRMLRTIASLSNHPSARPIPTALLGHALDPGVAHDAFAQGVIEETLDAVHAEFPCVPIDAYCEQGAWSVVQCSMLFERAKSLGHPIRVHTDQFTSLGMVERAIAMGARSVDHLEASSPETLRRVGESGTIGVLLPICGMHLDGRFADGRAIIDAGGCVALATNCNPGSAPSVSTPLAIALAVRHCVLSVHEAITACTTNGAAVLGLSDRGFIAPGTRADLIVLRTGDERDLAYELGGNPVMTVIRDGAILHAE